MHTFAQSYSNITTTNVSNNIDHSSPWATVRLVQIHSIDLRGHSSPLVSGRPVSAFDRTRSYFESNIFSDSALQELHAIDASTQPADRYGHHTSDSLKCFDLIIQGNTYFVATNLGVLMTGTLLAYGQGRSRSIRVSKTSSVYATCLQQAPNGRRAIIVGMSNGSVKIVWSSVANSDDKYVYQDLLSNSQRDADVAAEDFSAKSCAIQNIIREERRESQELNDVVPSGILDIDHCGWEGFDLMRFWNQTWMLTAPVERKQHVKRISICESTNLMLVLCGESLRQFDLKDMIEIATVSTIGIEDMVQVNIGQYNGQLVSKI